MASTTPYERLCSALSDASNALSDFQLELEESDVQAPASVIAGATVAEKFLDTVLREVQSWEPPKDEPDEAYERAAARARNNDFKETGGRDWT